MKERVRNSSGSVKWLCVNNIERDVYRSIKQTWWNYLENKLHTHGNCVIDGVRLKRLFITLSSENARDKEAIFVCTKKKWNKMNKDYLFWSHSCGINGVNKESSQESAEAIESEIDMYLKWLVPEHKEIIKITAAYTIELLCSPHLSYVCVY